jgi:hypothetical protein
MIAEVPQSAVLPLERRQFELDYGVQLPLEKKARQQEVSPAQFRGPSSATGNGDPAAGVFKWDDYKGPPSTLCLQTDAVALDRDCNVAGRSQCPRIRAV